MEFALAAAALAAIGGLIFIALRSQLAPAPSLKGTTALIQTRDGRSLRGVVVAQHSDQISVRDGVYLHSSGEQAMGGLVHIPRENVSYLQEIEP